MRKVFLAAPLVVAVLAVTIPTPPVQAGLLGGAVGGAIIVGGLIGGRRGATAGAVVGGL